MSDDGINPTVDRRRFLTVLGVAGAGATALSGCSTQAEKLIPYLVQSEDQVPGVATYYASTCTECSAGCGLHVKTREGRAIKLEGNPEHPVNRGKLCARGQASLQGLYNPGRVKAPMVREGGSWKEVKWDDAIARLVAAIQKGGAPLAVLSGATRGTFADLLADFTATAGGSVTRWEPLDHVPMREANKLTFGRDELPAYDFASARYILSFGADFLDTWHSPTENQIGYAQSHGFHGDAARHVHVAARRDLTGLNADEWLAAAPGTEAAIALAMANVVASRRGGAGSYAGLLSQWTPEAASKASGVPAEAIRRVALEFAAQAPTLAVAGGIGSQHRGAVELCQAVNVLNAVAGNIGQTVRFGADLSTGDGLAGVQQLLAAMNAGQVGILLVHEANPVYALPASMKFADALKKVPFKVSTATYLDETAAQCDLLLPNLHSLERWDDANPRAGVFGLMQPVMEPVFPVRHTGDVLLDAARKLGGAYGKFSAPDYKTHLRTAWNARTASDAEWRAALARGGLYEAAPEAPALTPSGASFSAATPAFDGDGEFVFVAYPHAFLHDGRGANRPWLLENPDPVTKATWSPWIELSAATARRLDIRRGEVVRIVSPHGEISGPAFPYAGLHDGVIAAPLGSGHTEYGQFAKDRGFNPLDLLGAPAAGSTFLPYASTRVRLEKTHSYQEVATTEGTPRQLGRGIAEAIPLVYARKGMTVRQAMHAEGHGEHEVNTELEVKAILGWRERQVEGRKLGNYAEVHPSWGMTVDLSKCTGCSACVTACYAENNIPTVGEDQVLRGREMSWMRIERYWEGGEGEEPLEARFVPMLCQQCENAPCEPVCPVFAAYHTVDGLNGQVYNRCVGTRYCSNNCSYKVRYFNWYKYNLKAWPEPLDLQLNPDVTVRARGVMEKCTFCVQRIRSAQHTARLEGRELRDGEFTTACAQACPSDAIIFGNRRDPASRVAQSSEDPRAYRVLEELNTRPAITYLAKVLNQVEA
jgi:molybdopterin-containing oxidoreductase family iron-sulfur binding subunit